MTRVDLRDALPRLGHRALGIANFRTNRGKMLFNRRQRRSKLIVVPAQSAGIRGLLLGKARCEHTLRFFSQLLECLSEPSQISISGVQFRDLPLIELLLARKPDEVRRRFTIGWR